MTDFRRDSMVRPQHREASHRTMNDAKTPPMSNESAGNFFEDFKLGQEIVHATPRTVTVGDVSLFTALYGSRFAVQSSDAFAQSIGYPTAPIDDMRFDVPVVGVPTLTTMTKAGATCLCITAGKTLMFDRDEMIRLANEKKIVIVAVDVR